MKIEDYEGFVCLDMDDGRLVFEPRETLSEIERERADLHIGSCPACQLDMDCDYLISQFEDN